MNGNTLQVLLIEDNPGDARLIREMLAEAGDLRFELTTAPRLGEGLDRLYRESFGLVLLDLSLPDSHGLATFRSLREETVRVPVVVLTGTDDTALALQALREGAQDYLVKNSVTAPRLIHALRYALSRFRRQAVIEREHRASEDEMRTAEQIWRRLLPASDPEVPGFDIHAGCFPALPTGGDFFDYLRLTGGRLGLVLGDVTGHGVGPALLMAGTRAYLRAFSSSADISEILTRSNRALIADTDDRNVTLVLASLDASTRTLLHASAAHGPGYVLGPNGEVREQLFSTDLALGIRPDSTFPAAPAVELHPGELVLFLTDGVTEAPSPAGRPFGVERALEYVRDHRQEGARAIVEGLYAEVRRWEHPRPQEDDVTAMVVKVLG
jgi:serine phosphatase RsbU (regulator of sigma subunit)